MYVIIDPLTRKIDWDQFKLMNQVESSKNAKIYNCSLIYKYLCSLYLKIDIYFIKDTYIRGFRPQRFVYISSIFLQFRSNHSQDAKLHNFSFTGPNECTPLFNGVWKTFLISISFKWNIEIWYISLIFCICNRHVLISYFALHLVVLRYDIPKLKYYKIKLCARLKKLCV